MQQATLQSTARSFRPCLAVFCCSMSDERGPGGRRPAVPRQPGEVQRGGAGRQQQRGGARGGPADRDRGEGTGNTQTSTEMGDCADCWLFKIHSIAQLHISGIAAFYCKSSCPYHNFFLSVWTLNYVAGIFTVPGRN